MITVEIMVPYLNVSYDFSLDETAPIGFIIEEVASLICLKEHLPTPPSENQLELFDMTHKMVLPRTSSLCNLNVRSGQKLVLC